MTAQNSAAAHTFFSSSPASGSYVLWHFISPGDGDSDEPLDCFWSPVVVALDVVSTDVVDLLIVVDLSEHVVE